MRVHEWHLSNLLCRECIWTDITQADEFTKITFLNSAKFGGIKQGKEPESYNESCAEY